MQRMQQSHLNVLKEDENFVTKQKGTNFQRTQECYTNP
jgi:hypothetical protein